MDLNAFGTMESVNQKEIQKNGQTTRNVYGWRQKPYHHEDGTTAKRWKRRSRLVAREFAFAEGKRDDIFSPAPSGHVLKLIPTILLQRVSEEEEAREGEGAFPRC